MRLVEVNGSTVIELQLYDGDTTQFPRVRVYNNAGTEQTGAPFSSPIDLTHRANGLYTATVTPTAEGEFVLAGIIYSDSGHTTINKKYNQTSETWVVRSVDQDLATLLSRLTSGRATNLDNLDNLDATVSSRLATTAFDTKLGTPAGASVSADIAAVKSDTGTLTSRLTAGRATNLDNLDATVSSRLATTAFDTKIGTPAGASVSVDIAAVKTDTSTLTSRLTAGRATNLDNLDATVSSRLATSAFNTTIGTPAGASVSADIAAVKSDTGTLTSRLTAGRASNLDNLDATISSRLATTAFDTKIGTPAGASVSADIASVKTDTTTLTGRLTAGRASNLDNLDATVSSRATQSSVDAIQNNTTFSGVVPPVLVLPTSGTKDYKFYARLCDTDGNPEDPDSNTLNIRIETVGGTVIVATAAMTRTAVGRYEYLYTVNSTDTERALIVFFEYAENAISFQHTRTTEVQEFESKLDTLLARLTATRANNLDNLDTTISSRLATTAFDTKIGTPAGVSVSADIAAVKSDTSGIKTKTDQLTFTGSNVNANSQVVSDKTGYALTPGEEDAIVDKVWDEAKSGHAVGGTFGDLLDVKVSSRESETSAATRATTNQTEHDATQTAIAGVQSDTDDIQSKIGTPAGASVSADIAAVKSETNTILGQTGTTGVKVLSSEKDSIVDRTWDELKSGHTVANSFGDFLDAKVSSRESEASAAARAAADIAEQDTTQASLAAAQADITLIKAKTDLLNFIGSNVAANAQVVADKNDYTLTALDKAAIVNLIWDELLAGHAVAGSTGEALTAAGASGLTASQIASAVWDELVSLHTTPSTFGDYVQAIRQFAVDCLAELQDGTHGLDKILAEIINRATALTTEVNQNETKIDALTPTIVAAKNDIITEVNQNETKIDALSSQVTSTQSALTAEINQNEVKIDAVAAQVGTIQNNTTTRFIVPERIIKPTSGTKDYQFHLRLYDESGNPEAPDSTPTIRIRRLDTLVDIVSGAAMTQDGVKVGAYFYVLTISSGTALYPMLVEATVVEGGVTRYVPAVSEIVEFESDLDAIQAQLVTIEGETLDIQSKVNNPVFGLSALKTGQTGIVGEINVNESKIDLIKAKTDNLPASPASSSEVAAVTTAVLTRPTISDIQTRLDTLRDNLKGIDNRDLTQVYDVFDLTPVAKTNDPRFAHLDADISSRSTLTASQVWAAATRTLTSFDLPASEVKKIWDYLASAATVSGSLGKRIADFLDAAVSTRATAAQVTAALAGVAQEATLLAAQGALTTEINQNEVKLNSVLADTATIKGKTNNLPSSPASETTVLTETSQIDAAIAALQLVANGIKTKTDNLPANPASQTAVLAIPTNPLRDNDARLDNIDVKTSTRSTLGAADLIPLAKTSDVTAAKTQIISEVDQNETKIDTVNTKVTAIKAKTDNLPSDPARESTVVSSKEEVLDAIDNIPGGGGGLTASQVWTYPTRVVTGAPQPDLSLVAKSAELTPLAKTQYVNRMSTAFNNVAGTQEVIAWAEKDGLRISGTNCIVTIKDSSGGVAWTASLATPSADGVFKFVQPITPVADLDYYIVISIIVDGSPRVNQQPFFTVG